MYELLTFQVKESPKNVPKKKNSSAKEENRKQNKKLL